MNINVTLMNAIFPRQVYDLLISMLLIMLISVLTSQWRKFVFEFKINIIRGTQVRYIGHTQVPFIPFIFNNAFDNKLVTYDHLESYL